MILEEIKERMFSGKLYVCSDESLLAEQQRCLDKLYDFNATRPTEQKKRQELLKEMFGAIGEGCYIEPPLRCNWGGKNVYFGNNVYANFNLTMVDECEIRIGNSVMFGPNVVIVTGTHPVSPRLREKQTQYNLPVSIGNNAWIGSNVVIMPGVNIGDNTIIGAGSIVTKNIPANVIAYGIPCKLIREINESDEKYYNTDKLIDI